MPVPISQCKQPGGTPRGKRIEKQPKEMPEFSGRYQTKQLTTVGGGRAFLEAAAKRKLVSHLFLNFFKNSTLARVVKGMLR